MSKNYSDEHDEDDDGYEENDDEDYDEDEENENSDDENDGDDDESDDSDDLDEDYDELEDENDESDDEDENNGEDEEDDEETKLLASDDGEEYSNEDEDDEAEDSELSSDEEDENPDDDEEATPNYEEGLVYVIMPYTDEHLHEVFAAIRSECSNLKLNAQLAREGVGSGLVIQIIRDLTERAEFIICDLTGERANVYYELGQAHGLGNDASRVLLVAKQGTSLPFNVAALHVYYYKSTEHLRTVVASNLWSMIQATRE